MDKLVAEMERVKQETDQMRKKMKQFELKEKQIRGECDERIKIQADELFLYQTKFNENQEKVE